MVDTILNIPTSVRCVNGILAIVTDLLLWFCKVAFVPRHLAALHSF